MLLQSSHECYPFLTDVPASAAYFGSYEIIQRWLAGPDGDRTKLAIWQTIFAGILLSFLGLNTLALYSLLKDFMFLNK